MFLALAIIPATRRFTAGWFSVLVGGCTTQLMALAIIQLMSGAELTMMHTLFAPGAAADNNFVILAALVQVGVLLGLGGGGYGKDPGYLASRSRTASITALPASMRRHSEWRVRLRKPAPAVLRAARGP